MILRNVEYVIACDNARFGGDGYCVNYGAHAFNSTTAGECATAARKDGWVQVTAKLWLCPKCARRLPDAVRDSAMAAMTLQSRETGGRD